jgi:hypothetical protein
MTEIAATERRCDALSSEEFKHLWFDEWRFDKTGRPDDAASFLLDLLMVVAEGQIEGCVPEFGTCSGQPDFMWQWLRSSGLVDGMQLTMKGRRTLRSLENGAHYELLPL